MPAGRAGPGAAPGDWPRPGPGLGLRGLAPPPGAPPGALGACGAPEARRGVPNAAAAPHSAPGRRHLERLHPCLRPAAGRRQEHDVRPERRQLRDVHQGVAGDPATGRHEEHASVHVRHEELLGETRRGGVRLPGGEGEKQAEIHRVPQSGCYP